MKQKGAALIITLIFISVLLIVGAAVAQNVTTTSVTNIRMENLDYLRLAAENGIEKGYAYLKKNYSTISVSTPVVLNNILNFNNEGSKYNCKVTIYNYDTINTSNYAMYTIVATSTSGSSSKTITANVTKGESTSVTTTPFADAFNKFYDKLNSNSAALINPVTDNSGQKDVFSNSGNTDIHFNAHTYFQGKINNNTFDPSGSVHISNVSNNPVIVTYPTTVETVQMPTFSTTTVDKVPQRDVIIKHNPAYPGDLTKTIIQYTSGSNVDSVIKSTFDGYSVLLVNGNLTIEGPVTLDKQLIYCTGVTDDYGTITIKNSSTSTNSTITFQQSSFSGKSIIVDSKVNINFNSAPNIASDTTNNAIKSYIYPYLSSTPMSTTVVIPLPNPGNLINYRE
jgi:hypothetical protein